MSKKMFFNLFIFALSVFGLLHAIPAHAAAEAVATTGGSTGAAGGSTSAAGIHGVWTAVVGLIYGVPGKLIAGGILLASIFGIMTKHMLMGLLGVVTVIIFFLIPYIVMKMSAAKIAPKNIVVIKHHKIAKPAVLHKIAVKK